jgi:hypothetical protein
VTSRAGSGRFELNSGQRRVGEIEREELETKGECRGFILKARQGGFSTDQQARALHQVWSQPNFDALTLAHTKEDTEKLFGITQRAIEHFPRSLLPTMGDKATSQISFPGSTRSSTPAPRARSAPAAA